ncbi:Ribosomal protein S11 [Cynara cardunculus var. scolymus]|uniref:Coiled-coil domain-containing protein 86 n=1 Tax=Cynara cardunculus var. scolymus TaxID=59895 RepID=A0A118K5M3_CYNCS|nr:Ribosomal protein S11 [Cynara cardunculus var. scolymus]
MACTIDFRCLDEGFGGKTYKRKRSEQQQEKDALMDVDDDQEIQTSKRQAVASSENPNKPIFGKPTYDGVIAGKVSGRKWKKAKTQRSSAVRVSLKKSTFEERAQQKEIKKAYKERMTELKEEIRKNKVEKRKKKEEKDKKKEENILKSGTKLQKITNPKTLKKLAKSKKRKLLKGTRRWTPFAAQTAVGNVICTLVEQGMQQAEVMSPGLGIPFSKVRSHGARRLFDEPLP